MLDRIEPNLLARASFFLRHSNTKLHRKSFNSYGDKIRGRSRPPIIVNFTHLLERMLKYIVRSCTTLPQNNQCGGPRIMPTLIFETYVKLQYIKHW